MKEALVPEEEQPYKVPDNWVWVRLNSIFEQITDQIQPSGNEKYIGLEHLLKGGGFSESSSSAELKSKKVAFKSGDVLYGKLRPYLNKHAYVNFDGVASTDILVFRTKYDVLAKILNHYLGLTHVISYANENSSGINLPRVSPKVMGNLPFPLPPFNEQKRIADKVEKMLDKISQAKQLIEEAKYQLFLNKKALIKNILFGSIDTLKDNDGIYTKNSLPEGWKWIKINDMLVDSKKSMVTGPFGTALNKMDYRESGVPVLGIDSIEIGRFIVANKVFITEDKASQLSAFSVNEDDVIISRSGTVGELCVVPKTALPAIISTNIIKLTLNKDIIIPEFFVAMFLNDGIVKEQVRELCKGSTREFLNQTILKSIFFPVPSLNEQRYILEKINKYSLSFDKIEASLLLNTDELEQSILSKAFSSELRTNDPNEESALNLLIESLEKQ